MSALRKSDQQRLRRLQNRQATQAAMSNPRHLICAWLDLIEVLDQFRREMVDLEGTIIDVDDLQVGSSGLNSPLTILEALSRIGLVEKGRKEIPLTRNSMIS